DQNLIAFWTEFRDQRAGHRIGRDKLSRRGFGKGLLVLVAPFPVFERRNPVAAAFIAMARNEIAFKRGEV
ncbi:MAG TPA: hypothetical protein VKS99_03290, partial [Blastocatellia bacterium]|nr:hypothetical protein [Blastocatellia bacterium]